MLIYLAMTVDLLAWGHKSIDKLRQGFFWRGRNEAKGNTVMWLGARYADPWSLVDLEFQV
jgi:hypothetical protein